MHARSFDHAPDAWIRPTELPKREQRLNVSVDWPGLGKQDTERIQTRVEQLVAVESMPQAYTGRSMPEGAPTGDAGDEQGFTVSVDSLGLPPEEARRLQTLIRRTVEAMLPRTGVTTGVGGTGTVGGVGTSGVTGGRCICITSPAPGAVQLMNDYASGQEIVITKSPFLIGWCGLAQYTIFGYTFTVGEDFFTITVEDGTPWGISQDEMEVGLESAPGVTWQKELVAWNECTGELSTAFTRDLNHGPHHLRIYTGSDCHNRTETVVFRKAKAFGQMTAMYRFDAAQFWRVLRGRRVTYRWECDWCRCGPS